MVKVNKKTCSNILLGVILLTLVIFVWFLTTQGAECVNNPVKYIEHKHNFSATFVGRNILFYENNGGQNGKGENLFEGK